MVNWFFGAKGINDKERDPGWDEYFSSNRSTVESLVRESVQNSLDAIAAEHYCASKGQGQTRENCSHFWAIPRI